MRQLPTIWGQTAPKVEFKAEPLADHKLPGEPGPVGGLHSDLADWYPEDLAYVNDLQGGAGLDATFSLQKDGKHLVSCFYKPKSSAGCFFIAN